MTGQLKRKGGRPCIPPAPQNAAECRTLIAQETVKTKPRERTLRYLYRLLRAFERADVRATGESKNRLLDEANRLKTAELELKRAEYQRRMSLGPLGIRHLQRENTLLKQRVTELENARKEVA